MRARRLLLLAALLSFAAILVLASPLVASAEDPEVAVRRIAKQLRCPICESVSVADSPAELAGQMRGVIRRKLETGETDQQILDYFVAAYGDSVLLEPPRRGLAWAVWLGPIIALASGAIVLAAILRVWVRPGSVRSSRPAALSPPEADEDARSVAQAQQELEAARKGLAG